MTGKVAQQSESRDRVLNAAYGLFVRNGLTAVSMQQIADEAGITKATLYHHFRDKHDLYFATMSLAITVNERALSESLAGSTDLQGLVRQLVEYIFGDTRADLQRLAIDFKLHMPKEAQERFWSQYQRPWQMIQPAVEALDHIEAGEAPYVARFIFGAAHGLSQLYRHGDGEFPISPEMLEKLAGSITFGITPRE